MTAELSYENFATNLNTTFKIHFDEGEVVQAVLSEISELIITPAQERFSLIFRAPNQPLLGQGMRRFEHEQIGAFDLFIVPVGRDDQGTRYEAVFNRLRPRVPK